MFGGMGQGRKIVGIILGLIFLAIGGIPLLNSFGVVDFSLPGIPMMVLWVLGIAGGIVLLIDGLKEAGVGFGLSKALMVPTLVAALALLAISLIPLLGEFGVIGFSLPTIGQTIMDVLFAAAGLLLIVDAFAIQF